MNIGVIIALFLSNYGYEWADGFFACCIGLFILKGAYQIGVEAVQTLLDRSLDPLSINKIMQAIVKTEGVLSQPRWKNSSCLRYSSCSARRFAWLRR